MRRIALAAAFAVATLLAGCGSGTADVDGKRIAAADDTPGEWLTHGRTYGEQRFSPLTQISTTTVKDLGLAWSYDLPENRGIGMLIV